MGPLDSSGFAPLVLDKCALLYSEPSSTYLLKLCTSDFSDFSMDFKDCRLCETGTAAVSLRSSLKPHIFFSCPKIDSQCLRFWSLRRNLLSFVLFFLRDDLQNLICAFLVKVHALQGDADQMSWCVAIFFLQLRRY